MTGLDPFLLRLLEGVLVIVLFQFLFAAISLDAKAKQLFEVILVVVVVVWVLFGSVLLR